MGKNYTAVEREANYFACCLLMPQDLFIREFKKVEQGIKDEDVIVKNLAKVFQVPLFAVVLRIQMLQEKLYSTSNPEGDSSKEEMMQEIEKL
jgi:Zn-dependent peptidase ImmA (M78 family)